MSETRSVTWDEMVDGARGVRPGFRFLIETVSALGRDVLAERARVLERAAIEEGPASLLAGGGSGTWRCDPLPLPLSGAAFGSLVAGLTERVELIEAVLADLYGGQRLLSDGVVPAAPVFASGSFMRARRGDVRPSRFLSVYAADVVRAPDGAWRVVADRTATQDGIMGAIQNRRLLRRIVPELFAREVSRIDGFLETWRERLLDASQGRAGEDGTAPGIALLTAGHRDPAWGEHVLLARALGCELVQGGDLTVRSNRLLLKTLRGLKPIDVLLNRQDAALLDPLELEWDDHAGVPGLMSLQRSGRVAIVNDPGSGLAEIPCVFASLPDCARILLGRSLRLAQSDAAWLGAEAVRARVLAAPEQHAFRPAATALTPSVDAGCLSARARARLVEAVQRRPGEFVAVTPVPASTCPCIGSDRMEPAAFALRVFLLHDGRSWHAMQGGFVRLLEEGEDPAGPLPRRGVAKDLFVLPQDPDRSETWLQGRLGLERPPPLAIIRVGGNLPARVAAGFFGLGRTLERLEMRARLVRALAVRLSDFRHRPRELVELRILAACLRPTRLFGEEGLIDPAAPGVGDALARMAVANSALAAIVRALGQRIELLHDRITGEMHLVLSHLLGHALEGFAATGPGSLDLLAQVTGRMLGLASALNGLAAESMVEGGGKLFLELGLRLARAETICSELAAAFGPASDLGTGGGADLETAMALVLVLRDSSITYRARYPGRLELAPVLDLVLADVANPRAAASQFVAVRRALDGLEAIGGDVLVPRAEWLRERSETLASLALGEDEAVTARALPASLGMLSAEAVSLRRAITRRYLDLLPEMRAVGA